MVYNFRKIGYITKGLFKDGNRGEYNSRFCLGCGLCAEHCPGEALNLFTDGEKRFHWMSI